MSENVELNEVQEEVSNSDAEARLMGWVPKEEFRGPEDHWVDSETFVERGRQILPIVKKNNKELTQKLLALEAKDRERDAAISEWKTFMKETQERERAVFTRQIAELREQKKQAISDGDGEAVLAIDDQIDAIKEKQREVKEAPTPEPSKVPDVDFQSFVEENPWYGQDEDKTAYAEGIGAIIRRDHPHLRGKAFLDMVAARVETKFPSRRTPASAVEGGATPSSTRKGKHSYNDLPEVAKKAHDKFVKQKLMTSEEYLANYFEG